MDMIGLLNEVQALARTGLHYSENVYDRERYERLLALACEGYEPWLGWPASEVQVRLRQEVGIVTPKIGADAAIFNGQGEILLMERADGRGWCLPCGWVEVNERPADAAVREVLEETGLWVVVERLVGVFTRPGSLTNGLHTMVAVVHLCKVVGGELTLSHEGLDLRYWPLDAVMDWHPNHDKYARIAHEMWQSEAWLPAISD